MTVCSEIHMTKQLLLIFEGYEQRIRTLKRLQNNGVTGLEGKNEQSTGRISKGFPLGWRYRQTTRWKGHMM